MEEHAIRKIVATVEDILVDGGRPAASPLRIAVAAAVIRNPLAGVWADDLEPLIAEYAPTLGPLLADRAANLLDGAEVEAFGKAALVGLDGEMEHGCALIHTLRFGNPVRERVGGTSLLPSSEKVGVAGTPIDVNLKHVHDHTLRGYHMSIEFRIADAPKPEEIVIIAAYATGTRPNSRLPLFADDFAKMGGPKTS